MEKLYIGTNTKMYKGIAETRSFLADLTERTRDLDRAFLELFVIPSFTALPAASELCKSGLIRLGAQNMCWEDEGQFTGEVSPLMLKEAGVQIVEIGHSERRHVLGETDEQENRKVLCALRHGLTPLLCIGETREQRDYGISDEVLRMQLKIGLHGVDPEEEKPLWIAYEPVWAIGVNGIPASESYVAEKHAVIRQTLAGLFGAERAARIPVLYGGSVNQKNARELIGLKNVDGLFIGRSAWQAESFERILRDVMAIRQG